MSDTQQKGLIGELLVLSRHLLPALGSADAVRCWTGPLGSHHDFEISQIHVEAKARGPSVPVVSISSEFQLDSSRADRLFLHVSEVALAAQGTESASTLADVAHGVRSEIAGEDMVAVELFEHRLATVGFNWTDDYSDKLWLVAGETLYEVRNGFPRITPVMYPSGIGKVVYTISLVDCRPFLVDISTLRVATSELGDVR